MKICYHCFVKNEEHSDKCSNCGSDLRYSNRTRYPNAIPCGSVLIGRYMIGQVLGQGGFGITYVAQDLQNQELVAIKEYFPDTLASRDASLVVRSYNRQRTESFESGKKSFLEEARTLARFIGSSNIVAVRSFFEENGTAYFVMEYISGISLKKYLEKKGGRITWPEAMKILTPVLDALSDVHAAGIIHRDVTPDNIAVTDSGVVKLLDFGAARYSIGEKSQSLDIILKQGYAPYEQYMHRSRQGPYTDVYSLAATFYNAVTGLIPPESVERVAEDCIDLPSSLGVDIPPYAEEALMKALAVRPEDRLQSMADFKYALTHGLRALENRKRTAGILRLILPFAAVVVIAAAAVLFYSLFFKETGTQHAEDEQTAAVADTAESTVSAEEAETAAAPRTEMEILLENAENSDAASQVVLGNMYYTGDGVEQDYTEALKWFTKAAEQDNETAQYILGHMYQSGEGTRQDYREALKWYTGAAEQGNADAQYQTGYFYEHALDTEQDYGEALKWYKLAAGQGVVRAQYAVASMYEAGHGADRNYEEALAWYEKAAEQNDPAAQNSIGHLYKYGYGVEKSDEKAFEWFEKSAEQGYSDAQNNLGMAYFNGFGVDQDYVKALEWYRKAAEQGHASAQNNVGWMYAQGLGVEQDNEKAFEWFEKAAKQDHPAAQNNLGYMYMEGIGRDPDYEKAREWFRKAADQGYGAASFSLGEIYLRGLGVDVNEEEAKKWYQKAAEQGYEEAQSRLDSL
ncbi:MAG: protein kinase [Eubacteriales bacterium]|nr:protein kinase [Eubacteriales bacterium]